MSDPLTGGRLDPDPDAIAARQSAEIARLERIRALRMQYAGTTNLFCSTAGLPVANVLAADDIASTIQAQELGSPLRMALGEIAMQLILLTGRLELLDGADALDRIPQE